MAICCQTPGEYVNHRIWGPDQTQNCAGQWSHPMSQWWDHVPGVPSKSTHCRQLFVSSQRGRELRIQPTMECGVPADEFFKPVRAQKSTYPQLADVTQEFEEKSRAVRICQAVLTGAKEPLNTPSLPFPDMSFTTVPEGSSKFQYPTIPPPPIPPRNTSPVHVALWRSSYCTT